MVEGILGKKIGMTRIFIGGVNVPITVIDAGGCVVTQKKTVGNDGYSAIQVGIGEKDEKRVNKAMKGHFAKAGKSCFYTVQELKGDNLDAYKAGQTLNAADIFKVGDIVDVRGCSKGKGFMGVMKRHNFSGGAESHGSMFNRAPGSIGSSSYPSRVFKGMRMAGHMGAKDVTVENLKVVGIKDNIIMVHGGVPGSVNTVVAVRKASKSK